MVGKHPTGMGVDASGGPVIDPTANVRALTKADAKRQDDLRLETNRYTEARLAHISEVAAIRAAHLAEIQSLHQSHDREIHRAEHERYDTVREIDVNARRTEADRQLSAIQTLANQTSTRIAALEKSSYEGAGKQQVEDPLMSQLLAEVKALHESRAQMTGKGQGVNIAWVVFLGAATLITSLIAIGASIFAIIKR